jgi:hypothetical protein
MKPSEPYIDALYEALENWFDKHLPPDEAARLREQLLDADDTLVPRLTELTRLEMERAVWSSPRPPATP